jgi:hypothetical protein
LRAVGADKPAIHATPAGCAHIPRTFSSKIRFSLSDLQVWLRIYIKVNSGGVTPQCAKPKPKKPFSLPSRASKLERVHINAALSDHRIVHFILPRKRAADSISTHVNDLIRAKAALKRTHSKALRAMCKAEPKIPSRFVRFRDVFVRFRCSNPVCIATLRAQCAKRKPKSHSSPHKPRDPCLVRCAPISKNGQHGLSTCAPLALTAKGTANGTTVDFLRFLRLRRL